MMISLTSRILFVLSCVSVATSSTASFGTRGIAGVSRHPTLFGVPRGGGLFGGKNDDKKYVSLPQRSVVV